MKILFFILLTGISLCARTQNIPRGTAHIETIKATVLSPKGDTLDYKTTHTYYDTAWHVLSNNNTLSNALNSGSGQVTLMDAPSKKVYADESFP